MQNVIGFYERVCQYRAALLTLNSSKPKQLNYASQIASETEIKDVTARDPELLLRCHYKLKTAKAGTQCVL